MTADSKAPSNYHAYLLRLRRKNEQEPWVASLENVTDKGKHHHFADLDSLIAFLVIQFGPKSPNEPKL